MARVTVEKYVDIVDCFRLVVLAAKRARDIGAGAEFRIPRRNDKNPILALREIEQKVITVDEIEQALIRDIAEVPEVTPMHEDENEEDYALGDMTALGEGPSSQNTVIVEDDLPPSSLVENEEKGSS
eukprot:g8548.t1